MSAQSETPKKTKNQRLSEVLSGIAGRLQNAGWTMAAAEVANAAIFLRDESFQRHQLSAQGAGLADVTNTILRDVAELPDRTSPDDWPDAMLVTADELQKILTNRLAALRVPAADDAPRTVWMVSDKTFSVCFATKKLANDWVTSTFSGSTAPHIFSLDVIGTLSVPSASEPVQGWAVKGPDGLVHVAPYCESEEECWNRYGLFGADVERAKNNGARTVPVTIREEG